MSNTDTDHDVTDYAEQLDELTDRQLYVLQALLFEKREQLYTIQSDIKQWQTTFDHDELPETPKTQDLDKRIDDALQSLSALDRLMKRIYRDAAEIYEYERGNMPIDAEP